MSCCPSHRGEIRVDEELWSGRLPKSSGGTPVFSSDVLTVFQACVLHASKAMCRDSGV